MRGCDRKNQNKLNWRKKWYKAEEYKLIPRGEKILGAYCSSGNVTYSLCLYLYTEASGHCFSVWVEHTKIGGKSQFLSAEPPDYWMLPSNPSEVEF